MVFDFFKKRSEEGLEQLGKLSDAASRGQLGVGLKDAAAYTRETNQAFASGLAKSRNRLLANLESIYTGSGDALEDLQDTLLQADLGMATTEDIVQEVKSLREDSSKFLSRNDLMSVMRGKLIETLDTGESAVKFAAKDDKYPTVLFIMGANGMGKTTTIGKLAYRLRTEGNQTVLVAACDTFRAGAVEQLQQWADRAEVDLYGPSESAKSPAAVLFGALEKAIGGKYDTLLVDTSGRLSNNDALTAELVKMKNVIKKRLSLETGEDGKPIPNEAVPHESLLVLDAAQGRMALDSAVVWDKEVGLTGLILTKLDGSARGGSVVAVSRELKLPVKLIGVGEGINDLRDVSYMCSEWLSKQRKCRGIMCSLTSSDFSLSQKGLSTDCLVLVMQAESRANRKEPCWHPDWKPFEKNEQNVLQK
jgi:fused signal recognition particle receptor